jgi:hypothetical protein
LQAARYTGLAGDIAQAIEAARAKASVIKQYEGQWDCDQRQGFGRLTHSDGTSWAGEWFADEKHGVGTLFRMDESVEMEGRWEEGKLSDPEAPYQYQDYPHYVKFHEQEVERAVEKAKLQVAAIAKEKQKLEKASAAQQKEEKVR